MFSGYQNKKKKKELTNAFDKLSKPAWKSTEKLDSVTKSRGVNPGQQQQQNESDVSNLRVNPKRKSLVMNSAKTNPTAEKVKKSTSIYEGLEDADIDKRPSNIEKALPPNPISKLQLDDFDTTELEAKIAQIAKEAGINFDTTKLSKEEDDDLDSILDQISKNIKETYSQKLSKEAENTVTLNKSLKSLEDNNTWIKDTCSQITQRLQDLENEVKSEKMLEINRPQLKENLKSIISNTLKANDDTWIPKFNELCQIIKSGNQQLRSDIHHICKMFTDTSWEKELRKRTKKCFDIGDEAAFQKIKINYTTLFKQLFPNHSCSDEFIIACNHLAKSYVFPPPSPKHATTTANNSENSSIISTSEDSSKISSPSSNTTSTIYTLKSKVLPPLHFSNKERADMFLSNLSLAKIYFQTDAMHLYKSYDEHRITKIYDTCPCILCEQANKHKHTATQCSFCNVHQNHNIKKDEENQEHCTCGNCIHFSHYIQGLRFLTDEFSDSTKYTASRSSSIQEQQQQQPKEKKSLNKLIGGLLFDNNSSSHKKK